MTPYKKSDSGIAAYEIRDGSIIVQFRRNGKYMYTDDVPGREHVEEMKRLALEGRGLATYISKNVGKRFARKM